MAATTILHMMGVAGFRHRITYLVGGALTAVVYYGIVVTALLFLNGTVPYLFVIVVSHFITVVIVYPWYRLVVFPSAGDSWLVGYLRFYVVGLSFLTASVIGLPILVELIGVPILLAQAFIIFMSLSLTYVMHRTWTFRDRRPRLAMATSDTLFDKSEERRGHVDSGSA